VGFKREPNIASRTATAEEALRARMARGEVPPLLYLYGADGGRILALIEELRSACVQEGVRDFNVNHLDARETGADRIMETARSLPMMSPRRLVIVANASFLDKGGWGRISPYLRDPTPSTCLILRCDRAPSDRDLGKLLAEHGMIVELRPWSERQAEAWVSERFRREGKRLQPGTARALVERVGTRQGDLEGEVRKLLAYVGDAPGVREEDVRDVAADARTHSIFDLTDAVGEQRVLDALRIVHRLLEEGSAPLAVLGMLARQVRLIWSTRASLAASPRAGGAGPDLPGPAFAREKLVAQARRWGDRELGEAIRALARADREIKTGRLGHEIVMDRWVLDVGIRHGRQALRRTDGTRLS
jgi:DNA polymerase-3 subunit delta